MRRDFPLRACLTPCNNRLERWCQQAAVVMVEGIHNIGEEEINEDIEGGGNSNAGKKVVHLGKKVSHPYDRA